MPSWVDGFPFLHKSSNEYRRDQGCYNVSILVHPGLFAIFCRFACFGHSFARYPSSLHYWHWFLWRVLLGTVFGVFVFGLLFVMELWCFLTKCAVLQQSFGFSLGAHLLQVHWAPFLVLSAGLFVRGTLGWLSFSSGQGFWLVISDPKLNIEKTCTDLGLILDKNLKWHNHLENWSMKTSKVVQMIRRNTTLNVNNKSKINTYKSLLIPTLLYAS